MNNRQFPIVLNNFNRLSTTKAMCEKLWDLGYFNLHILDNTSTYPPLLEWYSKVLGLVKVHYLERNYIQNAFYDTPLRNQLMKEHEWVAYTDSDLTLNPNLPTDFVQQLIDLCGKWGFKKAGFALEIEDLPDTDWGRKNKLWESRWWEYPLEKDIYNSQIDTTFAVIKPAEGIMFSALRVAGDFTARHEPWYTDFDNLNEEEKYYLEQSHEYSTYKRYYLNLKDNVHSQFVP